MDQKTIEVKQKAANILKKCPDLEAVAKEKGIADNDINARRLFISDVFALLKYLCVADGEISDQEIKYICDVLGISDVEQIKSHIINYSFFEGGIDQKASYTFLRLIIDLENHDSNILSSQYVIEFLNDLGSTFVTADGNEDISETISLSEYVNEIKAYRERCLKNSQDKPEQFNDKGVGVEIGKKIGSGLGKGVVKTIEKNLPQTSEPVKTIDIDFEEPYTPSIYTIDNVLRLPESQKSVLLYHISFVAKKKDKTQGWVDCRFVFSGAHRCMYSKKTAEESKNDPYTYFGDEDIDCTFDDYVSFDEEKYMLEDYSDKLFAPTMKIYDDGKEEVSGNGFQILFDSVQEANMLYAALLLSDYNHENNVKMYETTEISAKPFVMDMGVKKKYSATWPFQDEYDDCLILNNLVFHVYDEYMDELASGYITTARCGLSDTSKENVDYNFTYRHAHMTPYLVKGKICPRFDWENEDGFDITYQKTSMLRDAFHFNLFLDENSEVLYDKDKLTVFYRLKSHGQRCVTFKFSDERQMYMLAEWLCGMIQRVRSDYKMSVDKGISKKADRISPLFIERKHPKNISKEMLLEAGIDEERLSFYSKGFGIDEIQYLKGNRRLWMYGTVLFEAQKLKIMNIDISDYPWPSIQAARKTIDFDESLRVEFSPDNGQFQMENNTALLDISNKSILEYNILSYLWEEWINKVKKPYATQKSQSASAKTDGSEEELQAALEELDSLTGMKEVKDDVRKLLNFINVQKRRIDSGLEPLSTSNHIVFTGNPGTGKTTVARIIGKIYHAIGLLSSDKVVEVGRSDLVAEYIGQTAPKTQAVIQSAMGGILFIDEAYTLAPKNVPGDYGQEAIDTLLKEMEDKRDRFVVIVAGYKKEMRRFIKSNPGLESRFQRYIHFEDYNGEELYEILERMCKKDQMNMSEETSSRLKKHLDSLYRKRDNTFSNGRMVRNLYEYAITEQADRISAQIEASDMDLLTTLIASDFGLQNELPTDDVLKSVFAELDALIGMTEVKHEIHSLVDYIRTEQMREKQNLTTTPLSLHMVFSGNPGTGKTTVARLLGKIYKALGVTNTETVTEVTKADLVSPYAGDTGQKTLDVIDLAKGGILFIDEAYMLSQGSDATGQEAIDTLLKAMEDYRESLIVVVAGYREEMSRFIRSNPGLESRFNRYIEFEDYNPSELYQILSKLCQDAGMIIEEASEEAVRIHLKKIYDTRTKTFANAREMRNIFERAKVSQSQRLKGRKDEVSKEELSTFIKEDFGILDRNPDESKDALAELMRLTGLGGVKKEISSLISTLQIQNEREKLGSVSSRPSLHMVFTGNPGTGKTTVARLIARIYKDLGILSKGHLKEVDRSDLVAEHIGGTAVKTREVVEFARGGVLFIDEAYTLANGGPRDFGQEAIDTLLKLMEDYRESLVVIVAGYENEMRKFINSNPGLSSRFNRYIHFDDYSESEMLEIFEGYCQKEGFSHDKGVEELLVKYFGTVDKESFANGRGVRNLFERVREAQARRLADSAHSESDLYVITKEDIGIEESETHNAIEELMSMTGLQRVKDEVNSLVSALQIENERQKLGLATNRSSLHMVFTGNPGTGKTTVARYIATIYKELGILKGGQLIEADRSDLVAGYVGQTAPKTREIVKLARGGVLFIDEAYTLANGGPNDFGQEAIDELLKLMEDYRENLAVIVAGYGDEMRKFINSNPGLSSRFNRYIQFDDYSPLEMVEIFAKSCKMEGFSLDDGTSDVLRQYFTTVNNASFANARGVRNLYEKTKEAQAKRLYSSAHDEKDLMVIQKVDVEMAISHMH